MLLGLHGRRMLQERVATLPRSLPQRSLHSPAQRPPPSQARAAPPVGLILRRVWRRGRSDSASSQQASARARRARWLRGPRTGPLSIRLHLLGLLTESLAEKRMKVTP
jgi:hypothetical protein